MSDEKVRAAALAHLEPEAAREEMALLPAGQDAGGFSRTDGFGTGGCCSATSCTGDGGRAAVAARPGAPLADSPRCGWKDAPMVQRTHCVAA